jgi:phenylacetate-CoA ligase
MRWPALPSGDGAIVLSLLEQIEHAQWLPPDALRERQLRQLDGLLKHAHATVPFYKAHWGSAYDAAQPLTPERLDALPAITRRELQSRSADLRSTAPPPEHGPTGEAGSGGATGIPVRVLKTQLTSLFAMAFQMRDHVWHRRDMGGKLATVRSRADEGTHPGWGNATHATIHSGPSVVRTVGTDTASLLQWLVDERADCLTTYPSLVAELARLSLEQHIRLPGLREVRTFGEVLTPETRVLCRDAWGVPVTDSYSSDETGPIALQCPEHEHYHVHSEGVLLEVLDDDGRACAPGVTGRVVITVLHNFAMPLIRYELGDYATLGEACPCGRGLPVLQHIAGRSRNMLVTADGKRYWPLFSGSSIGDLPVSQYQLVQKDYDVIEARIVTPAPLSPAQEETLRRGFLQTLPEGIRLTVTYHAAIARSPSGKFEDFISELAARPAVSGAD